MDSFMDSTSNVETPTIRAALAELLAKVLRHDALAVGVARLSGMIARSEVVHVIGRRVFFQLDLAAVHRPEAQLLLLLPRWSGFLHVLLGRQIGRFFLSELVDLLARLAEKRLGDGAVIIQQDLMDHPE